MNTTEARLTQLQRARNEFKRQMDEVFGHREQLIRQQHQLQTEAGNLQDVVLNAISRGDISATRTAKARLAEIRQNRDELFELIATLKSRHSLLQGKFGEAHDRARFAESEVGRFARRIATLRRELAMAQRREGEFSPSVDNNSVGLISMEL